MRLRGVKKEVYRTRLRVKRVRIEPAGEEPFLAVTEQPDPTTTTPKEPETVAEPPRHTSRLLEAKRRAQKKMRKD